MFRKRSNGSCTHTICDVVLRSPPERSMGFICEMLLLFERHFGRDYAEETREMMLETVHRFGPGTPFENDERLLPVYRILGRYSRTMKLTEVYDRLYEKGLLLHSPRFYFDWSEAYLLAKRYEFCWAILLEGERVCGNNNELLKMVRNRLEIMMPGYQPAHGSLPLPTQQNCPPDAPLRPRSRPSPPLEQLVTQQMRQSPIPAAAAASIPASIPALMSCQSRHAVVVVGGTQMRPSPMLQQQQQQQRPPSLSPLPLPLFPQAQLAPAAPQSLPSSAPQSHSHSIISRSRPLPHPLSVFMQMGMVPQAALKPPLMQQTTAFTTTQPIARPGAVQVNSEEFPPLQAATQKAVAAAVPVAVQQKAVAPPPPAPTAETTAAPDSAPVIPTADTILLPILNGPPTPHDIVSPSIAQITGGLFSLPPLGNANGQGGGGVAALEETLRYPTNRQAFGIALPQKTGLSSTSTHVDYNKEDAENIDPNSDDAIQNAKKSTKSTYARRLMAGVLQPSLHVGEGVMMTQRGEVVKQPLIVGEENQNQRGAAFIQKLRESAPEAAANQEQQKKNEKQEEKPKEVEEAASWEEEKKAQQEPNKKSRNSESQENCGRSRWRATQQLTATPRSSGRSARKKLFADDDEGSQQVTGQSLPMHELATDMSQEQQMARNQNQNHATRRIFAPVPTPYRDSDSDGEPASHQHPEGANSWR